MQEHLVVPLRKKLKEGRQNLGSWVKKASGTLCFNDGEVEMGGVHDVEGIQEIIAEMY